MSESDTNESPSIGTFSDYDLLKVIAESSRVTAYRARHRTERVAERQGGDVGLYLLSPADSADYDIVSRLRLGAATSAKLEHPEAAQIHEVVEFHGRMAAVTTLPIGRRLADILYENPAPTPWQRALPVFRSLLLCVGHAHERNVMHGQLDAGLIWVRWDRRLIVHGWGMPPELFPYDPHVLTDYKAPEQRGQPFDEAQAPADVYALGLLLYHFLSGRLPWLPSEVESRIHEIKSGGTLVSPTQFCREIPKVLAQITLKATATLPEDRFASVSEFLVALEESAETARTGRDPPASARGNFAGPNPTVDASTGARITSASDPSRLRTALLIALAASVAALATFTDSEQWSAWFDRVGGVDSRQAARPPTPTGSRVASLPNFEMLRVEPGQMTLGSPESETGRHSDEAEHMAKFDRPLLVGTSEVSQALWRAVMSSDPVGKRVSVWGPPIPDGLSCRAFGLGADLPVHCVSWLDAVEFCNAISDIHGLTPPYKITPVDVTWDRTANGYRLPTEAEWEYIARGLTDEVGRYAGLAGDTRDPDELCAIANVAGRDTRAKFNPWEGEDAFTCLDGYAGLRAAPESEERAIQDMTGNVWEWVWDWYGEDYGLDRLTDPSGAAFGETRVLRGGSWMSGPDVARVANRLNAQPGKHSPFTGFRIVRSLRR